MTAALAVLAGVTVWKVLAWAWLAGVGGIIAWRTVERIMELDDQERREMGEVLGDVLRFMAGCVVLALTLLALLTVLFPKPAHAATRYVIVGDTLGKDSYGAWIVRWREVPDSIWRVPATPDTTWLSHDGVMLRKSKAWGSRSQYFASRPTDPNDRERLLYKSEAPVYRAMLRLGWLVVIDPLPTRKVVMPSAGTRNRKPTTRLSVAPGSSQSVAAAPVVLRFTLPAFQQGQPCADGAPLAWIDSVRVLARKRGPSGPYSSAAWVAYLAKPDTLLAQHAVSWTRIGQPDSFVVAAADTGATGWVQVHGTRGWSSVCRWVSVGAR